MAGTSTLLYIGNKGIPFVEGDHRVKTGEAYNFKIGMTKTEAFKSISKHYSKEGYVLRVHWDKYSPPIDALENFDITSDNRRHGEYQIPIMNLDEFALPFAHINRWDIDFQEEWVNTIYLEFTDGKLSKIKKAGGS